MDYAEVKNCYSKDIINLGSETESNAFLVIKRLENSQIENFYYSGNASGAFIDRVGKSVVTNCHVLRSSEQPADLIGIIDGDSSVDIDDYYAPEEMYFLATKLNEGLDEEVWINRDNDFPCFRF